MNFANDPRATAQPATSVFRSARLRCAFDIATFARLAEVNPAVVVAIEQGNPSVDRKRRLDSPFRLIG